MKNHLVLIFKKHIILIVSLEKFILCEELILPIIEKILSDETIESGIDRYFILIL